jgi:hypothetical protein
MKFFDDGVLQNLLDSVILGSKLFVGVTALVAGTYFLFDYLTRKKKDGE